MDNGNHINQLISQSSLANQNTQITTQALAASSGARASLPIAGQINSQSMTKIIAKDFASKYRDKREVFNFLSADVGKYF